MRGEGAVFFRRQRSPIYNFLWKWDLDYCASPTHTDTHLNSYHNAFFLDDCWEWLSTAVFLIESLMEKDHSPNALVDGSVRREEDLSKSSAVLLCVLHIDPLQSVPHGT